MSEFNWSCEEFNTSNASPEFPNRVISVLWSCVLNDAGYSVDVRSLCSIEHRADQTFLPYDQITEQQAIQWVWDNSVDKNSIEEMLQRQLDEKKLSSVITQPPPWTLA